VIDIIFGDVLVVLARFFATEVVTLRCKVESDMAIPEISVRGDENHAKDVYAWSDNHSLGP
jgi:hypothetical protein